jgi:hypothetical protein
MHIMTDIEMYSSLDTAEIIQISAVAFELNGTVLEPHELLQYDDRWFDACITPYYGARDQSNIDFWNSPAAAPAAARIALQPAAQIDDALTRFNAFVGRWLGKRGFVWAKPPSMDLRILRGAYREAKIEKPWRNGQEKDLTTLIWAARKVPKTNFKIPSLAGAGLVPHYALHDAVEQAVVAQAAFRSLAHFTAQRSADRNAMLAAEQEELRDAVEIEQGRTSPSPGKSPA